MNAIQLIRSQLEVSKNMTAGLLVDMLDAPMTAPTPNGGNHPTWIAGHLACSEAGLIDHIMLGNTNPLDEWKPLFGVGSEPTADAESYPPMSELLAKWDEVRVHTLEVLDSLDDTDLEKLSANPPEGREDFMGTYAKVLSLVAMHPLMHRGQVSDARRAVGREKLMA